MEELWNVETHYLCPVIGCDWETVGNFPSSARVEGEVRDHLESHEVIDWAKTINELKTEIRDLRDHIDRIHRLSVGDWND